MHLFRHAPALLLLLPFTAFAQAPPAVEWQRNLGGSQADIANSVAQTADGGYIICGTTESNDGDVTNFQGVQDIWVVKLDASGNVQWQRSLGGSTYDFGEQALPLADGGFLVIGGTLSNNGDVSGNHGMYDAWLVKLDVNGDMLWQRCYGGSMDDWARSIHPAQDGGFLIAGTSRSSNGDVTSNAGSSDHWIVKINEVGAIQWQHAYGGTMSEDAFALAPTADGGCIVNGFSASNDGDVNGAHGSLDQWVIKLDNTGQLEWQRPCGGSGLELSNDVLVTSNGQYMAVGSSDSENGDITAPKGDRDLWAILLSSTGEAIEDRSYGGSGTEFGGDAEALEDGGIIFCGSSDSSDGDLSENHGGQDGWLFRTSAAGQILWSLSMGGTQDDSFKALQRTSDGGYILVGSSLSIDGDLPGNNGSRDIWVVKLGPDPLSVQEVLHKEPLRVFPNPSRDHIQIELPEGLRNAHWQLHDAHGKVVDTGRANGTNPRIAMQPLAAGAYTLVFHAHGEQRSVVVVKE